jgi:threonine dehydrogenase-like Zn-dependent dehydrogenase
MKAVAVTPGKANSVHLVNMDEPSIDSVPNGRGVKVQTKRIGGCGTDREINHAEYGIAPDGYDYLVLGHENFGQVVEVGANVREVKAGDYVVSTVRRPGTSIYDAIGTNDMTTDDVYFERGISRLHGFFSEFYVESADYVVKIPQGLKEVGVLLEPTSVVEKGIVQAYEIQRRLKVWQPVRAAVLGVGPIGMLATMALKMRGLEVHAFGLNQRPYMNADILEAIGATYDSTKDLPLIEGGKKYGDFDIIFEATGYSPIIFDAMLALNQNGVLILSSVTGGDRIVDQVHADKINQSFVLGNKVMVGTVNANRDYFVEGVEDMARCEFEYPGWLSRLLTHSVKGIENYSQLFDILNQGGASGAIKAFCEVSGLE